MDALGFCFTLFGFVAGTGLWLRSHRIRARRAGLRQQISNATVLPIGALAAGSVGVCGRITAPSRTIQAPVSGDEVVGYRVRVVQKRYNRYGSRHWKLVLDATALADRFCVQDASGEVTVQATTSCDCLIKPGFTSRATSADRVPQAVRDFVIGCGCQLQDDYFGLYEVEWYEATIRESQRVHVFGRADRLPDPRGRPTGYRQTPTRLVIHRGGACHLVISDRNQQALVRTLGQSEPIRGLP